MSYLANWVSPEILRALGWTLLHFVWQGAGLAALLALAMSVCREAQTRYALAVATLVLMIAAPVGTFLWLNHDFGPAVQSGARGGLTWAGTSARNATALSGSVAPGTAAFQAKQSTAMLWLVEAWFLGVLLLSLRTAGGLLVIARMRRKEIRPLTSELYEKCLSLQKKMRLDRLILYCECRRLDAPAVLGWFRPVVLLPVRALTGLTEEQIQVVIAHELAHIRRLDALINFFQIAVETLLFYHPAVWWVSHRIRVEREVCCDDEALAVCGDAVNYARALTLMEEWRTAPSMMMAANRGPLAERILRLLRLNSSSRRVAGLGVGLVFLATALLVGHALLGVAQASLNTGLFSKQESARDTAIIVKPAGITDSQQGKQASEPSAGPAQQPAAKPQPGREQAPSANDENKKQSYIDGIEAAGFKDLSADELIAMKVQGITPEYIKGIRELGFQPTVDELIGIKVQGITPDYIRDTKTFYPKVSVDELIGMKVQGITPAYIKGVRDLGFQPSVDELIGIKVQGITPDYIREMKGFYSNISVDELIGMKVQGIMPQYVRGMKDLGLRAAPDDLIGMKVQGITPDYVRQMQALGLKPGTDQLIGMKVQGITPEYVKSMQAEGFKNLDCDALIGAKVQGITPEFIEKARKHGFQNLTLDKLMALKHADIL
jgi:beta-lactamase regulating signal transducer with metallopeptidase domain